MHITPATDPRPLAAVPPPVDPLRKVAAELEVTFLDAMLKSAGLGKARTSFGGGIGEDQFASFLRREQAESMVASGGIGLAERLFQSLKERSDGGA